MKINTASQPALAQRFNIHSVPTLLFVNNGEILLCVLARSPFRR